MGNLYNIFRSNYKNFKLEINRLIVAYKFDFALTIVDVRHAIENEIGYFYFVFTTRNVLDDNEETRISFFYPHDFISGNFSNTKTVDQINATNDVHVNEFEAFYFKIGLSEGEESNLKHLKTDLAKYQVQKFKVEHNMYSSFTLEELNQKISIIKDFIDEVIDEKI